MKKMLGKNLAILLVFGFISTLNQAFPSGTDQTIVQENPVPLQWTREFTTDFSKSSIDFTEVLSGGPTKDGIPAIDNPNFESIEQAGTWIHPNETVLVLTHNGTSKIYPLQILMWHEIVNDWIGTMPVAVTWCPLCNTAVGFKRKLDSGTVLDFGTTGRLRYSNLLMYDRQTESWWQQADGMGVIGQLTGSRLMIVPLLTLPFRTAQKQYPEAVVLSRATGFHRAYGSNPYQNYDSLAKPFLYQGPDFDTSRPSMERALVIFLNEQPVSVAYSIIQSEGLVEIPTDSETFIFLWHDGVASPLSSSDVATGPDRGSANAFYSRTTSGMALTIRPEPVALESKAPIWEYRDTQTGSIWDPSGRAVSGLLEGAQLEPAPSVQHFWFSASAFGSIEYRGFF